MAGEVAKLFALPEGKCWPKTKPAALSGECPVQWPKQDSLSRFFRWTEFPPNLSGSFVVRA